MRSWIGAVAVVLCGLGCSEVVSTHPVGLEPVSVDPEQWEGTWLGTDGALEMRVADAERGLLEAAWIESGSDSFSLEVAAIELRAFEDWTFASLRAAEDEEDEDYLWLRVESDGVELLGWWPDRDKFAELVEAGLLPGRVEESEVILSALEAPHLAVIRSDAHGALFTWDEPLVLRRLSD